MKSVSFSDLRKSSYMSNRTDQIGNSGDNVMKRSSSYKNLTYYASSEDILKRFSSKTSESKTFKEGYKSDDSYRGINTNQQEQPSSGQQCDRTVDLKITNTDVSIKELRAVILEQEKTISTLQHNNLVQKNENAKIIEEKIFQENRIKYLENMLAAYNTNLQDNTNMCPKVNETNLFKENTKKVHESSYNHNLERGSFNRDFKNQDDKGSSTNYQNDMSNNSKIYTDLNKRPSSADSTLNEYKYGNDSLNTKKRDKCRQTSFGTYTSDSEERNYSVPMNNFDRQQKTTITDYVSGHNSKADRERPNLSDFKNRLEEFTKYAKRSTEQNSFSQLSSTLPLRSEHKRSTRYSSVTDNYSDPQHKLRSKALTQGNDSRPPIDPYYKQRRGMPIEVKTAYDKPGYNFSNKIQDFSEEQDDNLKERVQKILEKHKYPSMEYRSDDNRRTCEYPNKNLKNDITDLTDGKSYERINRDHKYNYQSSEVRGRGESNIPRLDLTLNNPSADDLITKYLNYQGSTDVS